jgi:hypothetical protein
MNFKRTAEKMVNEYIKRKLQCSIDDLDTDVYDEPFTTLKNRTDWVIAKLLKQGKMKKVQKEIKNAVYEFIKSECPELLPELSQ